MKKIKNVVFIANLTFTLIILAFFAVLSSIDSAGTKAASFLDYDNVFIFFLYSLCVGLTFLVLDIKKMPASARRVAHIVLNYLLMVLFIFGFTGNIKEIMMIFVASFVFFAIYALCSTAAHFLRKLCTFLEDK